MVPMADNFNHSDVRAGYEIITKSLHKQMDTTSSYSRKEKYMNDYTTLDPSLNQ
jgi:hypothetical protein